MQLANNVKTLYIDNVLLANEVYFIWFTNDMCKDLERRKSRYIL